MPIESNAVFRRMSKPRQRRVRLLALFVALAATTAWCAIVQAADNVELSLRSLAQLQRLQEEKALREKLESLTDGLNKRVQPAQPVQGAFAIPSANPARPDADRTDRAAPPAATSAPVPKPPAAYTVLSVYGVPPALTVEAQTPDGDVHRFTERAVWGHWRIERIAADGVWLLGNGHRSRRFLGLGDMLRDTERP